MNRMNKIAIWQKIERLLEKNEHSNLVAISRADFEEVMKDCFGFRICRNRKHRIFRLARKVAQRVGGIAHALGTKWCVENRRYFRRCRWRIIV